MATVPTRAAVTAGGPGASRPRPSGARRSRARLLVWRILVIVALLGLWQLVVALDSNISQLLPLASDTILEVGRLVFGGEFWPPFFATLASSALGLVISVAAGLVLGLLIASNRFAVDSTSFVIDFGRNIPGLALIPLGLLLFGPTLSLDVMMIVLAATWPVLIATIQAVRGVDPGIVEMARTYGVPRWKQIAYVIAPAAMPAIAASIRLAAVLSILIAIGAEVIGGSPGIGLQIRQYQQAMQLPEAFAYVMLTGFLGLLLDFGLRRLDAVLLAWHHTPRRMEREA